MSFFSDNLVEGIISLGKNLAMLFNIFSISSGKTWGGLYRSLVVIGSSSIKIKGNIKTLLSNIKNLSYSATFILSVMLGKSCLSLFRIFIFILL